jgi:hypothetical protein
MHDISAAARLSLLRRVARWLNAERDRCHDDHPDMAGGHEAQRLAHAEAFLYSHGVPIPTHVLDEYATSWQAADRLADGSLDIATHLGGEPMSDRWLVREHEEDRLRAAVRWIEQRFA